MPNRPWLRGAIILLALAAAGAAVYFSPLGKNFDTTKVVEWSEELSGHWWAVPLFLLAYIVLDLLFIPTQVLSIAAVLMWGWLKGGIIELICATIGAVFPYLLARYTLRDWVESRLRAHHRAAAVLEREGFTLLLLLRVVPIIPYTALNYVAGLATIRLPQYVAATLIGMIPSTFVFAYFVQALADGVMEPRQVVIRGAVATALFAGLIIATRFAATRLRARVTS
jgi:uncharacterized membrane protein YdjX (TVP38/TMEM64 family)